MTPDPGMFTPALPAEGLLGGIDLPGRHELHFGRLALPFGDARDPGAARRMADAEARLVRSGLPLGGTGTGVATRFDACDGLADCRAPLTVETAWSVADLSLTGPAPELRPPDLTARAGWTFGDLDVGASTWISQLSPADRAWGLDVRWTAGRWTWSVAQAHERIDDTQRLLGLEAKRLQGERAALRVTNEVARDWTVSALAESEVLHGRRGVAATPWVRAAAGLSYRAGPLRWTLVEVADAVTLDPSTDCRRVSTRIERTGARPSPAPIR